MQTLVTIEFHGDALTAIETPDGVFVAVKPIAERLGLAWKPQFVKLKASELRWGVTILYIPSAGGEQETLCLPLNRLAMWLAMIHPAKVRPEVREALAAYQTEAADVLDRHFRLRMQADEAALTEARETLARARALALAANPVWNRIARFKEAGVTWYAMPAMTRLPEGRCRQIMNAMIDGGLIDVDFADPRREPQFYADLRRAERARERQRQTPEADVPPTPLEQAIEEMARAFPVDATEG